MYSHNLSASKHKALFEALTFTFRYTEISCLAREIAFDYRKIVLDPISNENYVIKILSSSEKMYFSGVSKSVIGMAWMRIPPD